MSGKVADVVAVILAGGSGSRLWPLSREHLPKQFLKIHGESTMLEDTTERLSPLVSGKDIWVVTSETHASGEAYPILRQFNTILEPVARNTAPAIAVAAALLSDMCKSDPVMLVMPADHLITEQEKFVEALKIAIDAADGDRLITFGIEPTRPETGFGYIQAGSDEGGKVRSVIRFTEKPDAATAESFMAHGSYYWNSGMFVWRASAILGEIREHLPELWLVLEEMRYRWQKGEEWQEVVRHRFGDMPSVSIDYGVMEHSDRVMLVPCDIGWSDVGSWDALYEVSEKDGGGNAVAGDVLGLDCRGSLLRSHSRLLAAIGLEDVIAVETPDAVLLARRGESQRVREVVSAIKARGGREHIENRTVLRPWGSYTVLEERTSGYKLKRIEVLPGASLSLQSHQQRSEHWVVVSGVATVTRGDETFSVGRNESTYIPIGKKHRLANEGSEPLLIVEVSVGDYLGEDDIERFGDDYGRSG